MAAAKEEKKGMETQATEAKITDTVETQTVETEYQAPTKEELNRVIRQHVWGALGVGLIPVPIVDLVALTGVQLNLLRKLAQKYRIPFRKDAAKNVLSSLVGSGLPVVIAPSVAASIVKFIPIFGETAGVVTMPVLAGAATYALGKVFTQHFASGGTFLTFDPEKVRGYYAEMFEEGKKVASNVKKEREAKK